MSSPFSQRHQVYTLIFGSLVSAVTATGFSENLWFTHNHVLLFTPYVWLQCTLNTKLCYKSAQTDFFIKLKDIKMLGLSSMTRTRRLSIYCSSSPIVASFWESCCFCFSNKLTSSSWVSWEYGPVPLASGAWKIQLNTNSALKSQLRGEPLKQPYQRMVNGYTTVEEKKKLMLPSS